MFVTSSCVNDTGFALIICWMLDVLFSVADLDRAFLGHPDSDPGKYRILILYPQKDLCNYDFLVIYCLEYSFVNKKIL